MVKKLNKHTTSNFPFKIAIAGIILIPAMVFLINLFWFRPYFIGHFFYREMLLSLGADPQLVTKVKVPILHLFYRGKLNDLSLKKVEKQQTRWKKSQQILLTYRDSLLSEKHLSAKKLMDWHLQKDIEGIPFVHHSFLINPFHGLQNQLPAYLDTYHHIESEKDVRAYMKRLSAFETYFDQLIERSEQARKQGIVPPGHLIESTISQMKAFAVQNKQENFLYVSLKEKILQCKKIKNPSYHLKKVIRLLDEVVYPSYQKMIQYQYSLLPFAPEESNAAGLPDGDNYYRYLIRHHTGMYISPDSIHVFGKSEISRIKDEIAAVLSNSGESPNSTEPAEALRQLKKAEKSLYQNTAEHRSKCLRDFESIIQNIEKRLPEWFDRIPASKLVVKRVPEFKEPGSSFAYYEVPGLGGSGQGVFYVRLDNIGQIPLFTMPTLAYHEGWPGHHLQVAWHLENKNIPLYVKPYTNNGYIEGWALYAERLMYEKGLYQNDPMGNLGRLDYELLRAVRLVVDTGIHRYQWTKKEAVQFMMLHSTLSEDEASTEVDRYIADPGQALAYTLGMHKILDIRNKAQDIAGNQFSLKEFHHVVLSNGILPMHLLEKTVVRYFEKKYNRGSGGKK